MVKAITRRRLLRNATGLAIWSFGGAARATGSPTEMVRADGIVGQFHPGWSRRRSTAVVMLNGSDGGIPDPAYASDLAAAGHPTLALAYIQDAAGQPEGVPSTAPLPLETVFRAIDWMKRRRGVRPNRVVLMGVSRGAELALLVASKRADVAAVVAFSPGAHAWGAPKNLHRGVAFDRSMWSLGGVPVPARMNRPDFGAPVRQWFARGTPVEGAVIRVEDIAGPILLVSSRSDGLWPAAEYADEIAARLRDNGFRHRVVNQQFDDASHLLMGPGPALTKLAVPGTDYVIDFGGSPEGTLRARDAAWATAKAFLKSL